MKYILCKRNDPGGKLGVNNSNKYIKSNKQAKQL